MCTERSLPGRLSVERPGAARPRVSGKRPTPDAQHGFSLVEVILFMVVVGVALAAVIKAFEIANVGSADPVLRRQSLAIAQALLEEIRFKPFGSAATDDPGQGGFAGPYTPANRHRFDDVDDYHGLAMNGITTLGNVALAGLEGYRATVSVSPAAFGGAPAARGYRITVTVTDPSGQSMSLDGYRADY